MAPRKRRAVSAKTEKLVRKVIAAILAEPLAFNMDYWSRIWKKYGYEKQKLVLPKKQGEGFDDIETKLPPCGTTCCFAGQTVCQHPEGVKVLKSMGRYITMPDGTILVDLDNFDVREKAIRYLGITEAQANRLFYVFPQSSSCPGWPEQFVAKYSRAKTAKGRAKAAAERYEHFIQTGE